MPAYNTARTLGACLEALLDQSIARSEYEILVVDDGSTDHTQEVAKTYGVRVLFQSHQGPGAARNLGVSHAKGELVLFTDADCVPIREWIEEMIKPFAEPSVVAAKGAYRTCQKGVLAQFIQAEFEERYALLERARYIDFVDSHSAIFRRQEFLAVGGFDPHFRISEDVDLSYRLHERGYRMVFNPKAIVYHCHPETLPAYFLAKLQRAYWRTKSYRQHPGKMLQDSYTPQILKAQIGLVLLLGVASLSLLVSPTPALMASTAIILLGFLLSTLSFSSKVAHRNPVLGLVSPLLLFYRAMALGLGFAAGFLVHWGGPLWHGRSFK